MRHAYAPEDYIRQLKAYKKLENPSFSREESRESVLGTLETLSRQKQEIFSVANVMIREYIETFEKRPDAMTEEDVTLLTEFMERLVPNGLYTGQATDFAILYRLAKLLAARFRQSGELDRYARALNLCSYGYRAFIQSHSHTPWESPYSKDCMALVQRIGELGTEGRRNALAGMSRTVVMPPDTFPLERFRTIHETLVREFPRPLSDQDGLILLITQCNILDAFKETCLFSSEHGLRFDRESVRPFLEEIEELVRENITGDRTYGLGRIKLENLLLITDYLLGKLSVHEFLDALDTEMRETRNSSNPSLRGYGLGGIGHDYLNLLFRCTPFPMETVLRLSRDLVKRVLPDLLPLSRQVNNPQFNRYIVTFLNAASLTGSFDEFSEIILESTVYADRALFIHTVMVRELSLILFDHMIGHSPEFFEGVAGKDADYVRSHRDEMKQLLSECCMFHDVGKFFVLDIVENAMRTLTDDELTLIREHPRNFEHIYQIIEDRDERVLCIRDCALTHHLWHDGTGGYPDVPQTKNRPFADILAIADSIDAGTDFLGRPYKACKTIDQLIEEIQSRSGTQYGPEAAAALSVPEVRDRMAGWVTQGRTDLYDRIYGQREHSGLGTGTSG